MPHLWPARRNWVKMYLLVNEKRSTLQGKHLLTQRAKTPFQKGLSIQESKQEVTNVVSIAKSKIKVKKKKRLPSETKNRQKHENRRPAVIESLHMQHCSLRGCIRRPHPLPPPTPPPPPPCSLIAGLSRGSFKTVTILPSVWRPYVNKVLSKNSANTMDWRKQTIRTVAL